MGQYIVNDANHGTYLRHQPAAVHGEVYFHANVVYGRSAHRLALP